MCNNLGKFYRDKFSRLMSTKVCVKGIAASFPQQNLHSRGIQCTGPHKAKECPCWRGQCQWISRILPKISGHKYSQSLYLTFFFILNIMDWNHSEPGWYPQKKYLTKNNFPFVEMISRGTQQIQKTMPCSAVLPNFNSFHPSSTSRVWISCSKKWTFLSRKSLSKSFTWKAGGVCWGTCHKITGLVVEPPIC